MSPRPPARRVRRAYAGLLRGLAWLAFIGMLLAPLGPRSTAAAQGQGVDAEILDSAETESSSDASAQRLVQRGLRVRLGPSGGRRWAHDLVPDLRPALARAAEIARVGVPRRVVPADDDPDEHHA